MNTKKAPPSMPNLPPLSLYIHIPWCVRKCPYCDFNSHKQPDTLPEQAYVDSLSEDMHKDKKLSRQRRLSSIFFGGGTPSLFSSKALGNIITEAKHIFDFETDIEITLEANPGTAEHDNFLSLAEAGINRLSMGVQSFNDAHLQRLGRIHSSKEVLQAFKLAREGGIKNINLDLMHGLPEQTNQQAVADLQQAIDLDPEHISWYQLTIEPNTVFYNAPPQLPEDDTLADIQDAGESLLSDNGYGQYEVSAYSKPTKRSAHNLNYWQFGDYLGIGAGAHGKITTEEGVLRYQKTRLPDDYQNPDKAYTASQKFVAKEKLALEFMMNALRLSEGVPKALFTERTGLDINNISPKLESLTAQGLLAESETHIQTSPTGARFLNEVLERFMEN